MKSIADLLSKISPRLFKGEDSKNKVTGVIKGVLGVEIGKDSVRFSGTEIYIEAEPILKSEIFLRAEEILGSINKVTGASYTRLN